MSGEPVVTVSVIVGLILTGLTFAASQGWIDWTDEDASALEAFLQYAIPLLLTVVGGIVARRFVTPVADPHDNDGNPLVPK